MCETILHSSGCGPLFGDFNVWSFTIWMPCGNRWPFCSSNQLGTHGILAGAKEVHDLRNLLKMIHYCSRETPTTSHPVTLCDSTLQNSGGWGKGSRHNWYRHIIIDCSQNKCFTRVVVLGVGCAWIMCGHRFGKSHTQPTVPEGAWHIYFFWAVVTGCCEPWRVASCLQLVVWQCVAFDMRFAFWWGLVYIYII